MIVRTDELIRFLSREPKPVLKAPAVSLMLSSLLGGLTLSTLLMLWVYGIRDDLILTWTEGYFLIKILFCASLALPAMRLMLVWGRPGMRASSSLVLLGVPFLTMAFFASQVLWQSDEAQRQVLIWGETWRSCPFNICLLSFPLMVASFGITKALAPTHLRWSGAGAGFLAGALAALVYCLHCPESALPFIGIWYSLGIAMSAMVGALLGPRVLRW